MAGGRGATGGWGAGTHTAINWGTGVLAGYRRSYTWLELSGHDLNLVLELVYKLVLSPTYIFQLHYHHFEILLRHT